MLAPARSLVVFLVAAIGLAVLGCSGSGGTGSGSAGTTGHGGTTGAAGHAGATGTSGSAGTAGGVGTGGAAGEAGSIGAGGTSGAAGTGGAASVSGSAGTGGVAGAAGVTGSSGRGGVGGSAGISGSAGTGGAAGSASSGGSGGAAGASGTGSAGSTGAGGRTCQAFQVNFVPQPSTAYLLVDRSGSMFRCLSGSTGDPVCADHTNTTWYKLKTAIEAATAQLDTQVRFGFTTIYGTNPAGGGSCPALQGTLTDNLPPALNNAAAIATLYDDIPYPTGVKLEGPASESIANVTATLTADPTQGRKYIIFVTDGQPDYCDDGLSLCPPDSVIYQLQKAYLAGITTRVFGIQTPLFDLPPGTLQAFANAGAGEPTMAPLQTGGSLTDFFDMCSGSAGWGADLTASGKPKVRGTTLGTYSGTMGPTTPYTPTATNQDQLVSQLSAALSGVKSCSFDLKGSGGTPIKLDTAKLAGSTVTIMGANIAQDATNGWSVTSNGATVVLNGSACTTWRLPQNSKVSFDFPCDAYTN